MNFSNLFYILLYKEVIFRSDITEINFTSFIQISLFLLIEDFVESPIFLHAIIAKIL